MPLQRACPSPFTSLWHIFGTLAHSPYSGATPLRQQHEPTISRQPRRKQLLLTYSPARRPPQPPSSRLPSTAPLPPLSLPPKRPPTSPPPCHALRSSPPSASFSRLSPPQLHQRPCIRSSWREIRLDRKCVRGAAGRDQGLDRAVSQRVWV